MPRKVQHRLKLYNYIEDIAEHEAGHAVVAAYLRLPLLHAAIVKPGAGSLSTSGSDAGDSPGSPSHLGRVDSKFNFTYKAYKRRRDADGKESVDPAKQKKEIARKHIVMTYAGEAANNMLGTRGIVTRKSLSGDLKCIRYAQKANGIPARELPLLKRRAQQIVRIPYVRAAIQEVAWFLCHSKKRSLSGAKIRATLKFMWQYPDTPPLCLPQLLAS